MFKGQETRVDQVGTMVPIEAVEHKVPAVVDKWYPITEREMPRFAMVTAPPAVYGSNKRIKIRPFVKETHTFGPVQEIYVPSDFKVKVLTGKMGERMTAEFRKIVDISRMITHLDMTTGSDPEVFVEDGQGNLVNAFDFLPHEKERHLAGGAYWDGFQAEFKTTAGGCMATCLDSTQMGLKAVLTAARKKYPKAKLSIKNVYDIPYEVRESAKPEYVALGCKPSLNVYGIAGQPVSEGKELPWRFAGGHYHFGTRDHNQTHVTNEVKALDAILGIAGVSLFEHIDNPVRRQFYGLPGEHRLPAHGLEYRTLSNAILCHPAIFNLCFDIGRSALRFGYSGLNGFWKADEKEVIETILACDARKAREILKRNEQVFMQLMNWGYLIKGGNTDDMRVQAFKTIMQPVEETVQDPTDIEGNWNLDGGWVGHCDGKDKNWSLAYHTLTQGKKIA